MERLVIWEYLRQLFIPPWYYHRYNETKYVIIFFHCLLFSCKYTPTIRRLSSTIYDNPTNPTSAIAISTTITTTAASPLLISLQLLLVLLRSHTLITRTTCAAWHRTQDLALTIWLSPTRLSVVKLNLQLFVTYSYVIQGWADSEQQSRFYWAYSYAL